MRKIVVGVDGSRASNHALRFALSEARRHRARLRAIHAWAYVYNETELQRLAGAAIHRPLEQAARETLDAALDAVSDALCGVDVEPEVVEGAPADVLIKAARSADLLVVGSHGHGRVAGLLLGSVSQRCAELAPCTVAIVRSGRWPAGRGRRRRRATKGFRGRNRCDGR